ncbi:hypothetical protein B9G55_06710 [Saccharibacillus sp. O16]|nr:hypothetical protein B9G55_06710 [Saccharibacillus sp. O16]
MNSDLLVRRAVCGDAQAFAELIDAERVRMLRVASYYVRSRADAEDAVQEALCRAFAALPSLKEPAYFRTWLTRIVINASLSLLQRSRRLVPWGDAAEDRPDPASAAPEQRIELLEALADLPPKYRRIVILRYLHNLKQVEIAQLLELPLGTVKTLQSKALKLLREHYRHEIAERRTEGKSNEWRDTHMPGDTEVGTEQQMVEKLRLLRNRAETFAQREAALAEAELRPFIEEVFWQEDNVKELLFVWTKPGTEIGLSVTLNAEGELMDYAVDPELYGGGDDRARLETAELLKIGKRFVCDHYPEALETFGEPEAEDRGDRVFFTAYQFAAGMPLPRSGYWIDVHRSGFVSAFKYFGEKPLPKLPDDLLAPQEALNRIADGLEMKLYFNVLHESVYAEGDDRLHLIYMPEPFLTGISALRLSETKPIEEQTEEEQFNPCGGSSEPITDFLRRSQEPPMLRPDASLLERIGIREQEFELLREADAGRERAVVYRRKDASANIQPQAPYTLDSYIQARSEDTIKLRVDRETGRIVSFMDFREERGDLNLDDSACVEIALQFAYSTDPVVFPYLLLNPREEDEEAPISEPEDDESVEAFRRRTAIFRFSVCKNGVPGFMHDVSIGVNRTTGFVVHYIGSDLDAEELQRLSILPTITPGEAKRLLLQRLNLRLSWEIDYNNETPEGTYLPLYKPTGIEEVRQIRMIEAHSAAIISEKG